MGAAFGAELEKLARNGSAASMDRARALYEMQRHGAAPNAALLTALSADKSPEVRAAVVYIAGVQGEAAKAVAAAGLKDRDPVVRRRAAEALVRMGQSPDKPSLAPVADIYALLNDHRSVRSLGGPHRDRAHGARRVEGSRAQGNESAWRARRHARLGQDRQRREPAADARQAARHAEADEPVGREQAAAVSRADVHDHRDEGRPQRRAAGAAQRPGGAAVPVRRRARQPRARAAARLRGPARGDPRDSRRHTQGQREAGAAAALSLRAADGQAGLDDGPEDAARRGDGPRREVARRRAVHQLRRPVLRLDRRSLRERCGEAAAVRKGAGLLAAHRRRSSPRFRRAWRQGAADAAAEVAAADAAGPHHRSPRAPPGE